MNHMWWWQAGRHQGIFEAVAAADEECHVVVVIPVRLYGWYSTFSQLAINVYAVSGYVGPYIDTLRHTVVWNTGNVGLKILEISQIRR